MLLESGRYVDTHCTFVASLPFPVLWILLDAEIFPMQHLIRPSLFCCPAELSIPTGIGRCDLTALRSGFFKLLGPHCRGGNWLRQSEPRSQPWHQFFHQFADLNVHWDADTSEYASTPTAFFQRGEALR